MKLKASSSFHNPTLTHVSFMPDRSKTSKIPSLRIGKLSFFPSYCTRESEKTFRSSKIWSKKDWITFVLPFPLLFHFSPPPKPLRNSHRSCLKIKFSEIIKIKTKKRSHSFRLCVVRLRGFCRMMAALIVFFRGFDCVLFIYVGNIKCSFDPTS